MLIPLQDIRRGTKTRALNEATLKYLMDSLPTVGLISPIIVKEAKLMREQLTDGYLLIAGNHRLTAAERLGWDTIEADIWPADTNAVRLELIEVDENLCRAELTAGEKARAIKTRKILWESLKAQEEGESGNLVPTLTGRGHIGFASATAEATGISKRAINQYLRIADQLGDLLDELQGTELDSKPKLLELASVGHEARSVLIQASVAQAVEEAAKPAAKTRAEPKPTDPDETVKKIIRSICKLPETNRRELLISLRAMYDFEELAA